MRHNLKKMTGIVVALLLLILPLTGCGDKALDGFALTKSETALYVGETERLACLFIPGNADELGVFWSSDDNSVARVDNTGLITALSAGATTIRAESYDGGYTASCAVRVYKAHVPANGIQILVNGTPADTYTASMGSADTLRVSVKVLPESVSNGNYTLSCDDSGVVSLSPDGIVTPLKIGTAVITAVSDDGEFKATLTLTLTPAIAESFSLGRSKVLGAVGLLPVKLTPVYNNPNIEDKSVSYESADKNIAAVNENGEISFVGNGETTIRATHIKSGLKSSVKVIVTTPEIINTAAELAALDNIDTDENTLYVLGNDIDLSAVANFDPIGYDGGDESPADSRKFNATLDGNGYKLLDLNINRGSGWAGEIRDMYNLGLFVYIGRNGNVRNLTIENAKINGRITGTLAGANEGVIENCAVVNTSVNSTISWNGMLCATNGATGTIANCIVTGSIADRSTNYIITGRNYGYIENVITCGDNLESIVKNNGLTNPMLASAYTYGCTVMSLSDMLSYGYDGFSAAVWNITAGKLPTVKTI